MISWSKHYKKGLLAIGLLLATTASIYAQGDAKNGEKLFKANCAACHALDKQLVGPALGGVVDKVKKEQNLDEAWFIKWIKDNKALRASGDKYANELYEKFNKVEMTAFPSLSDQDIKDILEYTTNPPKEEPKAEDAAGAASADQPVRPNLYPETVYSTCPRPLARRCHRHRVACHQLDRG